MIAEAEAPKRVLGVDVGGSHVKFIVVGSGDERRRFDSGPSLTASEMVPQILADTSDWHYDFVSVGIPAPVADGKIATDPVNLGKGWVGFDFDAAFGKPTKVINDAAMQALGSYEGGKMLFLGLGTGLGSTLIVSGTIEPMELGHLPFRKATFEDYVGERGLERLGKKKWQQATAEAVMELTRALQPDYVVLGGGNAKKLDKLPPNARLGANDNAFVGAARLWDL
jgi:polyphosphate glucokinase